MWAPEHLVVKRVLPVLPHFPRALELACKLVGPGAPTSSATKIFVAALAWPVPAVPSRAYVRRLPTRKRLAEVAPLRSCRSNSARATKSG